MQVPDSERLAGVRLFAPPDCVEQVTPRSVPAPAGAICSGLIPAPVRSWAPPSPWLRSGRARLPAPPPGASPAECRASAPLPPLFFALPALPAPAPVPLRAALAPRAAAPAVPPLSPLVWPPGHSGREQPEEEPQPGGGGRSPWRTVKEAARRKCATTMTVSGRGACSRAAGRARRGDPAARGT